MALEAFINGDKQKRAKKRGRTLRFDLELAPPTEASTNEFSYTELAEGEQRKVRQGSFTGTQSDCGVENAPGRPSSTSGCDGVTPTEKDGFCRFAKISFPTRSYRERAYQSSGTRQKRAQTTKRSPWLRDWKRNTG